MLNGFDIRFLTKKRIEFTNLTFLNIHFKLEIVLLSEEEEEECQINTIPCVPSFSSQTQTTET